jgi:hypothetical protein
VCHKHHPGVGPKRIEQHHIDQAWAEQQARQSECDPAAPVTP